MSNHSEISHVLHPPRWAAHRASHMKRRFASVLHDVARGAVEREDERRLPFAELELLKDAGFTRATLPEEFGGGGASLSEGFELLSHLAQHDSNLAQILRSHFALVERQLRRPRTATASSDAWRPAPSTAMHRTSAAPQASARSTPASGRMETDSC
jgi:alkylation response protein AidB-like acyl-CoA dehydrogenase